MHYEKTRKYHRKIEIKPVKYLDVWKVSLCWKAQKVIVNIQLKLFN